MEILNSIYNSNNNIFFGNKINWVRQGTLSGSELKLVKQIRSHFDEVSSVYSKMGSKVQSQFIEFHSKLVEVPKLRGYIFEAGENGNRLQLSKTKSGKNNNEILTFTILDRNNEAKLHLRVNDSGDYYISDLGFGKENIPENKLGVIERISTAMNTLQEYALNFPLIKRMIKRGEHEVNTAEKAVEIISKIDAFPGYQEEITQLMEDFYRVNELLSKNPGKMVEYKQRFLEYGDKRSRGWTFKNSDNGYLYTIFPLAQKATNAVCKIIETSQDGNQKVFALCKDGKIAIPIDINPDTLYIRDHNMQFLTEEEAKNNQVKEIISLINKKVNEFERFILEERHQTPEDITLNTKRKKEQAHLEWRRLVEKTLADEQKAAKKAEMQAERDKAKEISDAKKQKKQAEKAAKKARKEQAQFEHDARIAEKKAERAARIKEIEAAKEKARIAREKAKQAREAAKEQARIAEEKSQKVHHLKKTPLDPERAKAREIHGTERARLDTQIEEARTKKKQAKEAAKPEEAPKTPVQETAKPMVSVEKQTPTEQTPSNLTSSTPSVIKPAYMLVEDIVLPLNRIFDTKYTDRSTHLIHETLPDGKVFSGRFHVKRPDGSKITVARVRSKKLDSFTYLSIKITEKDGTEHVINIDPKTNGIINSADGKPVISKRYGMKLLTMYEFMKKNKWAVNIPQYMQEITKVETEGKPKFIKFIPSKNSQVTARERAALRMLEQIESGDVDPSMFL